MKFIVYCEIPITNKSINKYIILYILNIYLKKVYFFEKNIPNLFNLEHLLDESIDLITLLTASTSFVEMVKLLSSETTLG